LRHSVYRIAAALAAAIFFSAAYAAEPAKPGLPSLQHPIEDLKPAAMLKLGKTADWVDVTPSAIWVGASGGNAVHAIDPATRQEIAAVPLPGEACAGLSARDGALWVPLCGAGDARGLARIDLPSRSLTRVLPFGPEEEGGVAAGSGFVWIVTGERQLLQIEAASGKIRRRIVLPPKSFNPLLAENSLWITNFGGNRLIRLDPRSGKILGSTPTGPSPRFLTAGAGSIWTLNQGDGSVTRIDAKTGSPLATIALGVPGHGGDIAFGDGKVWVTMAGVPLTAIDPATNQPVSQWVGSGGDSLKVDAGVIWLTDYHGGTVAAIPDPLR